MPLIYHIVSRQAWEQRPAGPYLAASLDAEGFIHCSYAGQVARVANRFCREEPDLLVFGINPQRLSTPVRDEDPGEGELFPHVYGPLDEIAVVEVTTLHRAADGQWEFHSGS